jgi:hypothetical protein
MKWFLTLLERLDRKRVIPDRDFGDPYLTRYYLFLKERRRFPFNIFLHQFHKSDEDMLHDHPWSFVSIIVKGGYWEHTTEGRFWRGAGSIRRAGAASLHRVELAPGVDTWTIFIPGPQVQDWGFVDHDGHWTQHEAYFEYKRKIAKLRETGHAH